MRYGGHTSCVAIAHDGRPPTLVLDAGTGLRRVPELLGGEPFRGTIVLGHLHWDHHVGLPFFTGGDRDDARVHLAIPAQGEPLAVMDRAVSPPFFPITLDQLRGSWTFAGLETGTTELEGFDVLALDIPHKGGRTFGFRVTDGDVSVAYLSDHSPTQIGPGPSGHGELHESAMALAGGADLLIHDAQYTADEFAARKDFGHCTIDYALELATAAGVGELVLFHHDPNRTDAQLDELVARLPSTSFPVCAATEMQVFDLVSSTR